MGPRNRWPAMLYVVLFSEIVPFHTGWDFSLNCARVSAGRLLVFVLSFGRLSLLSSGGGVTDSSCTIRFGGRPSGSDSASTDRWRLLVYTEQQTSKQRYFTSSRILMTPLIYLTHGWRWRSRGRRNFASSADFGTASRSIVPSPTSCAVRTFSVRDFRQVRVRIFGVVNSNSHFLRTTITVNFQNSATHCGHSFLWRRNGCKCDVTIMFSPEIIDLQISPQLGTMQINTGLLFSLF